MSMPSCLKYSLFISLLFSIIILSQEYEKSNTILFDSDKEGSEVYINEKYLGTTPLSIDTLKKGIYNFKFVI